MELANSLAELINNIWSLASKLLGYTCNLRDNVNLLKSKTDDLQTKSADVKTRVEDEERGGARRPTEEVTKWSDDVRDLVERGSHVLQEANERDEMKCLSRCLPWNCWWSCKLGKRVDGMLNEAGALLEKEGQLGDLTVPLPPPVVLNMPTGDTVGLDTSLKMVWKWLVDERQGVIGLWGQGGVGKTTLMKRVQQELSGTNLGFEVVIWVEASKQVDEVKIQDTIRKRLGIKEESWNGWDGKEKVHHLRNKLANKKFVLLIDDLWKRLDLCEIGVPCDVAESRYKIVFTTREEDVCKTMGAKETSIKLQCLTTEQALLLFENNVGKSINSHSKIPELARGITEECKGLPLALVTVGRAMVGTTNPDEWEEALAMLKENPHDFSGMEDMYRILKFSYDRLNNPIIQRCFLYCCLFPEDYHIRSHDLIGLWIGEKLLEETDDVYSLRSNGKRILGRLMSACLLESGRDDGEAEYIKMHDVIRDMAIWITCNRGEAENKWLVMEKEDLSEKMISKWRDAEKVSLWGKWIQNIGRMPFKCFQLKTLIVRETNVRLMPRGFFYSMMACLMVLDLSDNKDIQSFPEDICSLVNLQYLNLSATGIRELPREIKNLTRLQWLLLDYLEKINLISVGAIASLPLSVLSMWGTFLEKEEEMVEELERMRHLTDLSVSVGKSSSVQKIFLSLTLQRSIRRAWIADGQNDLTNIVISHSSTGSGSFLRLETLLLNECLRLVKMEIAQGVERAHNCPCFPSLIDVRVNCCKLPNLSWLMHAPKLRQLTVVGCDSMEKIIGDGFAPGELEALRPFSDLKFVKLRGLPKLTSDQVLYFPQGVKLNIVNCPGLGESPWDPNSAR